MHCIFVRFLLEWDDMSVDIVGLARRRAVDVFDIRSLLVHVHCANLRSQYTEDCRTVGGVEMS
jgi:hypothetical protein